MTEHSNEPTRSESKRFLSKNAPQLNSFLISSQVGGNPVNGIDSVIKYQEAGQFDLYETEAAEFVNESLDEVRNIINKARADFLSSCRTEISNLKIASSEMETANQNLITTKEDLKIAEAQLADARRRRQRPGDIDFDDATAEIARCNTEIRRQTLELQRAKSKIDSARRTFSSVSNRPNVLRERIASECEKHLKTLAEFFKNQNLHLQSYYKSPNKVKGKLDRWVESHEVNFPSSDDIDSLINVSESFIDQLNFELKNIKMTAYDPTEPNYDSYIARTSAGYRDDYEDSYGDSRSSGARRNGSRSTSSRADESSNHRTSSGSRDSSSDSSSRSSRWSGETRGDTTSRSSDSSRDTDSRGYGRHAEAINELDDISDLLGRFS